LGKHFQLSSCPVKHFYSIAFFLALALLGCPSKPETQTDEDPSPAKSAEAESKTFEIEPGFKIQLVASEPMVQDPVVIQFDEDGRPWVVEMRGFMPDIDGTKEREPVGRVSVLEDTDGDGQMDRSTIYLDSLIMPRALAVISGGALVVEQESLWITKDTDGDLKADSKILVDSTYAGSPMPEHSGNGLWRGVDNWYYNAKSRFRYRFKDGTLLRDSTEFRGQWGISHDDKGRLYYNYNWSQLHADLVPPNYLSRNKNHTPISGIDHGVSLDRRVYPIRPNPAVNRGNLPGNLDERGRLLEFTAACSPLVYREPKFPKEFYGNVFVCEPSGNLIKRNVLNEDGLMLSASDPHPGKEFLASTDERFRPVFLASGQDGNLYVADMYRGLIQHGAYVTPYLRERTLSRKLVHPINYGRIWRIAPSDWKPSKPEKLSALAPNELVGYLSSKSGWHRDVAQRLLVERNDASVKDALTNIILKSDNQLGRFHALWTMEGLKLVNADFLFPLLRDPSPLINTTALRMIEPFVKGNKAVKEKLERDLVALWPQAPIEQTLQIALIANNLDAKVANEILVGIAERNFSSPVMRDAIMSSLQNREMIYLTSILRSASWQVQDLNKEILIEMIATSIVRKRNPTELRSLLSLLDGKETSLGWKEQIVLNSLVTQSKRISTPIALTSAPRILSAPSGKLNKTQVAALNSLFEWPGHVAEKKSKTVENTLNEKELQQFAAGRSLYLTSCAACHGSDGTGMKRFAPTLVNSEWVLGDEKRLSLIVLHGLEGPISVDGVRYDVPDILPVMPSHSTMTDGSLANILTYIRNEWGNHAGAVGARVVGGTRHTTQGRVIPWTADELNKHIENLRTVEE
jgi:mono/diheme cytochrome c family protein